jgi:hypothetical protein
MAWVTATLIASAGVSAYGAYKQGKALKKAGEAVQRSAEDEAQLSDYNAGVAKLQAADALSRGADDEARFRDQVRGVIGAQRAGFAAGNIDVGFGSAVDVQADAATLGELDALTIRTNAAREAWGYQVNEIDLKKRGEILRKEGKNAAAAGRAQATAAYIGGAGTLLGSAGNLLQAKYGIGKKP